MSQLCLQPKLRTAVVVLGMHRSGTSALAGVVARLGCDLPKTLMEPTGFNPKGYYESLELDAMNDAILASGGSCWDDWQQFNPNWIETPRADEFLARGAEVLDAEYDASSLFLIKDPRICRLMPFWGRLFQEQGIRPVYVHTHRDPFDTARSLQRREGWPIAYGVLLWLRHVLDAEIGSRGAERCFVSYRQLLAGWGSVVANIQAHTGLNFPRLSETVGLEVEEFLTSGANGSTGQAAIIKANQLTSDWVHRVCKTLERWVDAGEDIAGLADLDAVRTEFNAAAPMFSRLAQEARKAAQHEKSIEVTAAKLAEARRQLHSREEELKLSGGKVSDLQVSVEGYQRQVADFQARLITLKEEFSTQSAQHAATEARSLALTDDLAVAQVTAKESHETAEATLQDMRQLRTMLSERLAAHDTLQSSVTASERENARLSSSLEQKAGALADLKKTLSELDQEKWQLQSELAQRSLEAEDVGRQNSENAARVAALEAEVDRLGEETENLRAERDQIKKNARLRHIREQKEFEQKVQAAMSASRTQADNQLESLKNALSDARNAVTAAVNAERQRLAEIGQQQAERIAELETANTALLESTSWRITGPIRRLVTLFRR